MNDAVIKFVKLGPDTQTPYQANTWDAGYDVFSPEACTVKVGERRLIKTQISCMIPEGMYMRIAPRSGLAYKYGIDVLGGVIDTGYRGEVGVILINFGEQDFEVKKGDRIAQFIFEKCFSVKWEECESLDETERGLGFGSSGT